MLVAVAEIEHERRLRIVSHRGRDAGRLPRRRIAAVGGDREFALSIALPSASSAVTVCSPWLQAVTVDRRHSMPAVADTAFSSADSNAPFGMLRPNESSPISLARKVTTGLRSSREVASTMRIARSGADMSATSDRTPSLSR